MSGHVGTIQTLCCEEAISLRTNTHAMLVIHEPEIVNRNSIPFVIHLLRLTIRYDRIRWAMFSMPPKQDY